MSYFISVAAVIGLLAGWLLVQALARQVSARHPEFGPLREEGSGCGGCTNHCHGQCSNEHEG